MERARLWKKQEGDSSLPKNVGVKKRKTSSGSPETVKEDGHRDEGRSA